MMADEFKYWLENNGFGTVDVDIYENFQPLTPDDCITVYDINAPGLKESSSLSVDLYGIQVLVRNSIASTAKNTLLTIHKTFMGFGGEKLINSSDNIISMVFVDQPPHSIGKDNKNRSECEALYNIRVESQDNIYRL